LSSFHSFAARPLSFKCAHPRDLLSFPTRRSSDLPPDREMPGLAARPVHGRHRDRPAPPPTTTSASRHSERNDREDEEVGSRHDRSEEHTSELQSRENLVCRLLLEKKNPTILHNSI